MIGIPGISKRYFEGSRQGAAAGNLAHNMFAGYRGVWMNSIVSLGEVADVAFTVIDPD